MSENDKSFDSIRSTESKKQAGKSKLLSPHPKKVKYVTEMLHAFSTRQISFSELVKLDPKKIQQISEMGFVKLRNGRYKEARKIFEILTFIDHKNYFHHLALGGAYQKLKLFVDALFQYGQVLKLDSKNVNAYVNRGEIYLRMKNYRRAAEDFREAILLDQEGKNKFSNRARSLVVAIKRSMARDKELKAMEARGELNKPKRPAISPLKLVRPTKK